MKDISKTNINIYKTRNYDLFRFFDSNRRITKNDPLKKEILSCNKLKFHPIVVNPDFFVIDGQHRLSICKEEGLEVYFIIDNDSLESDINKVQSSKSWRNSDFLHYYMKRGFSTYIFMDERIRDCGISITTFLRIFGKVNNANSVSRAFREGSLLLNRSTQDIRNILDIFKRVRLHSKVYLDANKFHRDFETSLLWIISQESFCCDQFMKAIKKNPDIYRAAYEFNRQENIKDFLVNKLYNPVAKKGSTKINYSKS